MKTNVSYTWKTRKQRSWRRIWEDLEIGYLDRDLLPLLILMNRDEEIFTTSSCSGRITVMDSEFPWDRDETNIIFKSHIPVELNDLNFIFKYSPYKKIWIIVNGPIIHFYSSSTRKASRILNAARRIGFKHSGIIHATKTKGFFVELITGIYLTQLIRTRDNIIISIDNMKDLLTTFNSALIEGKNRLQRLFLELKKILPENVDEEIESDLRAKEISLEKSPIEIFEEMIKSKNNS
ncbi:MAG: hypothetical protein QXS24_04310 [Desulfurococcaceae archaeon]